MLKWCILKHRVGLTPEHDGQNIRNWLHFTRGVYRNLSPLPNHLFNYDQWDFSAFLLDLLFSFQNRLRAVGSNCASDFSQLRKLLQANFAQQVLLGENAARAELRNHIRQANAHH